MSEPVLPENYLKCMTPQQRRQFGKGGMTAAEATAKAEARSERELQRQISQYLDMRDIPYSNSRMDKRTTTPVGNPDYWICFKGRCIAVECKMPGRKLTPEQQCFKARFYEHGGIHLTCYNLGMLKAVLDDLEQS